MTSAKERAHDFLSEFEHQLGRNLPAAGDMQTWVRRTVRESKGHHTRRHLRGPEAAFLNIHVVPALATAIRSFPACASEAAATHALLNEHYPSMKDLSSHSPARTTLHPFTKALGANAQEIYNRWFDEKNRASLVQSYPDFALREPFPHKIVFEGKYFAAGGSHHAERQLVANIYQAFFYRGLPYVPETAKGRATWDYDYACLLAYDASPAGALKRAWCNLPSRVRKGFWAGANIYVMILGGQGRPIRGPESRIPDAAHIEGCPQGCDLTMSPSSSGC